MNKVNLELAVLDTKDPRFLSIMDLSDWSYLSEKIAIVEIILPGYVEPVVYEWDKGQVNVFNSYNLLQNCTDPSALLNLPDGIYQITIKGSPDTYNYTISYLKTDLVQIDLDNILIASDLNCMDMDVVEQMQTLEFLIKSAEANVRHDNVRKADDIMTTVYSMIEKMKRNCNGCA